MDSSAEARASFLAGYQRGYRPSRVKAAFGRVTAALASREMAATGYRDGMLDGGWHRAASQPFQAECRLRIIESGGAYVPGGKCDAGRIQTFFYREGYMNGYRYAYFRPKRNSREK